MERRIFSWLKEGDNNCVSLDDVRGLNDDRRPGQLRNRYFNIKAKQKMVKNISSRIGLGDQCDAIVLLYETNGCFSR